MIDSALSGLLLAIGKEYPEILIPLCIMHISSFKDNTMINLELHDDFHRECLMTLDEFLAGVKSNCLTDYDGFGELATISHCSDIEVSPSDILNSLRKTKTNGIPDWVTHVCWYNK